MINSFDIDIFKTSILFVVGNDEKEITNFYYKNVVKMTSEELNEIIEAMRGNHCDGLTMQTDSCLYIVWIDNANDEEIIAHEIFHVANKILMERGFNHDADDEPWAYLIGYITRLFYNWMCDINYYNNK